MSGNMPGGGPPGWGQHMMRGRGNMRMGPPNFHSGYPGPQGPPGMMNRGFRPRFRNNRTDVVRSRVITAEDEAGDAEDAENEAVHEPTAQFMFGWIQEQHPNEVIRIMDFCRDLLGRLGYQFDGYRVADAYLDHSSRYSPYASGPSSGNKRHIGCHRGGFDPKRGRGGLIPNIGPNNLQWTPGDNSHKITTTMKPLPEPEIIPPSGSSNYPEAAADRDKLKILTNNINMMNFELNKICNTFKIPNFDKEKISTYPEEAKPKLETAVTCLEKAEQTLGEFKEFLRTEKYKEWNEKQSQDMEDKMKELIGVSSPSWTPHPEATNNTVRGIIGAMPKGQPHASTSKDTKPDPPADLKEILGDMPVGVPFKSTP